MSDYRVYPPSRVVCLTCGKTGDEHFGWRCDFESTERRWNGPACDCEAAVALAGCRPEKLAELLEALEKTLSTQSFDPNHPGLMVPYGRDLQNALDAFRPPPETTA